METNKTINRIRFAHWKKSSLAPRAKALGFSRYCKRYKTREDMSLPREQLAKVRTPFKVNEVNGVKSRLQTLKTFDVCSCHICEYSF